MKMFTNKRYELKSFDYNNLRAVIQDNTTDERLELKLYEIIELLNKPSDQYISRDEFMDYTSSLLITYKQLFKKDKMSFAEFTLVKSIIGEIQWKYSEKE